MYLALKVADVSRLDMDYVDLYLMHGPQFGQVVETIPSNARTQEEWIHQVNNLSYRLKIT